MGDSELLNRPGQQKGEVLVATLLFEGRKLTLRVGGCRLSLTEQLLGGWEANRGAWWGGEMLARQVPYGKFRCGKPNVM